MRKIQKSGKVHRLLHATFEIIINFHSDSSHQLNVKKIHSLYCRKAPGPSKIPALALKDGCNEIYTHLTFLYNELLKNKTYPCKLKKAIVTPIYIKEDPELPENYRPISITGALSKVFEKLLYKQINEYLIFQKLLGNTQFWVQNIIFNNRRNSLLH